MRNYRYRFSVKKQKVILNKFLSKYVLLNVENRSKEDADYLKEALKELELMILSTDKEKVSRRRF